MTDEAGPEEIAALEAERPRRRGDCVDGLRPCPWVSCRYHLAHERIRRLSADDAVDAIERMDETCTLDLADHGGRNVQAIANALGVSRPLIDFNLLIGLVKLRERTTRDQWDEPAEREGPNEHLYSITPARRDRSRRPL
jgi:hypothetical protein